MSNLYESFKKADIGLIFMKVKKMSAIDLFYTKVLKNTVINLFTRTAKYRHSSVYTKAKKKGRYWSYLYEDQKDSHSFSFIRFYAYPLINDCACIDS